MSKHPSHKTRFSFDASSYDEICELCGATDQVLGGWAELALPCSKRSAVDQLAEVYPYKVDDRIRYIGPHYAELAGKLGVIYRVPIRKGVNTVSAMFDDQHYCLDLDSVEPA